MADTRLPRGARLATSFARGLGDLVSRPLISILLTTVVLNLVLLLVLWFGLGWLLTDTTFFSAGWLEWIADIVSGLGVVALTLILFPVLATVILGMFLDAAAGRVARRHYPWLGEGRGQPFGEMLAETVRFLVVVIVLNLIVLPTLFFPPLYAVLFWLLNGYLFGREYFEMVAVRWLPGPDARRLRGRNGVAVFAAGVLITLGMSIPFLNLIVPLWAVAMMVHVYAGLHPRE
jgi:CysZ protein